MWIADLPLLRTKGARNIRGITHLLSAGFMLHINGKAVFFKNKTTREDFVLHGFLFVMCR